MIRAVFFDAANTLLHKPALLPAMAGALRSHGIDLPDDELARRHRWLSEVVVFPDRTSRGFYDTFNAQLLRAFGIVPAQVLLDAIFAACSYLPWQPFPDTDALARLDRPLGILSNWDSSLPERLASIDGVQFRWVLGSQQQGVRKPDTEFFRRMIDACDLEPAQIAYVGDSLRLDIEPALALGVRALLIDRDDLFPHANVPRLRSLDMLGALL